MDAGGGSGANTRAEWRRNHGGDESSRHIHWRGTKRDIDRSNVRQDPRPVSGSFMFSTQAHLSDSRRESNFARAFCGAVETLQAPPMTSVRNRPGIGRLVRSNKVQLLSQRTGRFTGPVATGRFAGAGRAFQVESTGVRGRPSGRAFKTPARLRRDCVLEGTFTTCPPCYNGCRVNRPQHLGQQEGSEL